MNANGDLEGSAAIIRRIFSSTNKFMIRYLLVLKSDHKKVFG